MSFSSEVKEELKTKTDTAKHCQIDEFAAMMADIYIPTQIKNIQ